MRRIIVVITCMSSAGLSRVLVDVMVVINNNHLGSIKLHVLCFSIVTVMIDVHSLNQPLPVPFIVFVSVIFISI